jgi:hypothetical protein
MPFLMTPEAIQPSWGNNQPDHIFDRDHIITHTSRPCPQLLFYLKLMFTSVSRRWSWGHWIPLSVFPTGPHRSPSSAVQFVIAGLFSWDRWLNVDNLGLPRAEGFLPSNSVFTSRFLPWSFCDIAHCNSVMLSHVCNPQMWGLHVMWPPLANGR